MDTQDEYMKSWSIYTPTPTMVPHVSPLNEDDQRRLSESPSEVTNSSSAYTA